MVRFGMKKKYDEILQALLDSIERRDGTRKVEHLRQKIVDRAMEGMKREMILQILEYESPEARKRFLLLYPELKTAYRNRIC